MVAFDINKEEENGQTTGLILREQQRQQRQEHVPKIEAEAFALFVVSAVLWRKSRRRENQFRSKTVFSAASSICTVRTYVGDPALIGVGVRGHGEGAGSTFDC